MGESKRKRGDFWQRDFGIESEEIFGRREYPVGIS
jgi:hypothetical protein